MSKCLDGVCSSRVDRADFEMFRGGAGGRNFGAFVYFTAHERGLLSSKSAGGMAPLSFQYLVSSMDVSGLRGLVERV